MRISDWSSDVCSSDLLGHDCRSGLESGGFDPQVGFLHADRPGRASLALDVMEELRPVLADRLALTLINRGQIKADEFIIDEGGEVSPTEDGRKTGLVAWRDRTQRDDRQSVEKGKGVEG